MLLNVALAREDSCATFKRARKFLFKVHCLKMPRQLRFLRKYPFTSRALVLVVRNHERYYYTTFFCTKSVVQSEQLGFSSSKISPEKK